MTGQLNWKLIANLGDVNPIDHGGYFVYEDTTGVYGHEAEVLLSPDDDEGAWLVYRFEIPRCTNIGGILSDNKYHPECYAWFAKDLQHVADYSGVALGELTEWLCGEAPTGRAEAYRMIGEYHGFINFDQYPLTLAPRAKVERRYKP